MEKRWVLKINPDNEVVEQLSQSLSINKNLLKLLVQRRMTTYDEAKTFFRPKLENLHDPFLMKDMDKAVDRIIMAIDKGEKILIYGDYDVDGASSSAILSLFLTSVGVENEIYIPDRIFEGYGPNPDAIQQLVERGAKLIVTVDCGSSSFESLEEADRLGVDVCVLDHHQMGTEQPKCVALVNPNRQDDLSGLGYLCAAGVVFMT